MNLFKTYLVVFWGITIMILGINPMFAQQKRTSLLIGTVKSDSLPLSYATVYLKGTNLSTNTNGEGKFIFHVPSGSYTLGVKYVGYVTFEKSVDIKSNEKQVLHIQLKEDNQYLKEVVVEAKSLVKKINESAYNVVAIDAKALRNTNMDIAQTLDKVTGIKIREDGGVGSSAQISLNGFTGRHVKFFMDGIPLDGSGDGFPISNIPLGIAERIEVYKGVVPVEFGADALGGAINIVTEKSTNTILDASYSYGSFNTHKSSLSFSHTMKNGITMQLNAYQNYSDNDYKVKINEYLDLNSSSYINEPRWFKRFHDKYHNEAVTAKVGLVNKSWADRLALGIMYTQEYAEIQNANIMRIAFGGKERKTKNVSPTLEYEKRNLLTRNLNISLAARYDRNTINNIDTLARTYSWTGGYIPKTSQGEADKTVAESIDKSGYITANINYAIAAKHFFSVNNIFSDFKRTDRDEAAASSGNLDRKSQKNVLGLSYKFAPSTKWNALAFVKYYYTYVKGPIDTTQNATGKYVMRTSDYNLTGYGAAATYFLTKELQLKASVEKTYRLPTPKELFGDGSLEIGNATINPENSRNVNLNVSFNHVFSKDHTIILDAGFIYRDIRDFIKRVVDSNKGYASSENLPKVLSAGGEFEARYFFKNKFSLGGNLTYQNMRNKGNANDYTYNDRIPNIPYLFGNIDANYNFLDFLNKGNTLSIGYNLLYTQKYYKDWESEGGDMYIPRQFSHDVNVTYTVKNGRYNFALGARNITDELLYDNYSLQKPGRSFYIKFRYFLFKRNNIN